jgi:hypothetical protein
MSHPSRAYYKICSLAQVSLADDCTLCLSGEGSSDRYMRARYVVTMYKTLTGSGAHERIVSHLEQGVDEGMDTVHLTDDILPR